MYETVDELTGIIKAEADIIDRLFRLLLQHIGTEDPFVTELIADIETVGKEIAKATKSATNGQIR